MEIRKYRPSDCKELSELFHDTVHSVNIKDYSKEQVNAWATGTVNLENWNRSFIEHYTVVAVIKDYIVGFGDIDKAGYLNRLFVHKDYQRKGIAKAICDELENSLHDGRITTHASITAKPFFENRGYRVLKEQEVKRNGIRLKNYIMEKN